MSEGVTSGETEVPARPAPLAGEPIHPRPPTPPGDEAPRRKASNLVLRLITAGMLIPPIT